MSADAESPPIYLRVLTRPKKERARWEPNEERPNDHLLLVLDTETTTDMRQDLRFGVARVYAFGNLTRTVVFYETVNEEERGTICAWANSRGFDSMPREAFVLSVFLPLALDQRAVVVGFNLPFDLSRLAVDFAPKRNVKASEAWTLRLLPTNHPAFAFIPGVRIQHVDARKSFISFTGTKGKRRAYRGAFVDLKTLAAALAGASHSLKSAGEAFGCSLKKSTADYSGPVTPAYLDYCLNDVSLTAELYEKCLVRYREFNLPEHPSRVFSSASLGKAAFRARGVRPPSVEDSKLLGRVMAAFYAGKVECRVVGCEVPDVAVLDFTSQYPSLFCLLGAERFLTAERLEPRDTTEEVRALLESLTADDLLRRETWENPLMWSLCEVEADGVILPARSPYSAKAGPPTIGWNHVTTEKGATLPYLLPDLLAAKLLGGRPPKIARAVTFAPAGRQSLSELSILGATVGPDDNLIQRLSEARIHEKTESREGWEARALGLKILVNAASYGVFVEVNVKRHSGEMEVCGLDSEETFEEDGAKVEEPGELFSPLLGATITSGAHLLLALLDTVAARQGGEVVYCDTDSAFVTPSKVAPEIARAFDALNPYSVPVPLLKDETPAHTGTVSFFGLSSKRYCLFERGQRGRVRVLKGSDHGLGMYQVPTDREEFTKRVWERLIEAALDGEEDFSEFGYLPATAQFALTTPPLLPRVAKVDGIRPFNFLTIRYLNPAALPDGAPTFELLPFHSPKEPAWQALAEEEDAKTWAHILEAFSRHRDRKYLLGPDGRIVRRQVVVRKSSLVGLGKEGTKLAARLKIGRAAGSEPTVFVDWKRRLLAMGRPEARRLGLPWRFVTRCKAKLRAGTLPTNGAAVRRLKRGLLGGSRSTSSSVAPSGAVASAVVAHPLPTTE
jgi:hypothetical protein